jgi:hypothetical protein
MSDSQIERLYSIHIQNDFRGESDYDETFIDYSYDDVIARVAKFLAHYTYALSQHIECSVFYKTKIFVEDTYLEFTSEKIVIDHKWYYGTMIKEHPAFKEEINRIKEENLAKELARKEELAKKQKEAEHAIYLKVKAEVELND